jgi:hypothetical protein
MVRVTEWPTTGCVVYLRSDPGSANGFLAALSALIIAVLSFGQPDLMCNVFSRRSVEALGLRAVLARHGARTTPDRVTVRLET